MGIIIKRMHFRKDQNGSLIIPLIVSILLFFTSFGFAIWAYTNYTDQRDNSDQRVALAVEEATTSQKAKLEADFAEAEKKPTLTWVSSSLIGSVSVKYPKNWSVYVEEKETGSELLSGYFHPKVVANASTSNHALRIQVDESNYDTEVSAFDQLIKDGEVKTAAITKSGVVGVKFSGQINTDYKGALVIFKLRDKTLKVWTESDKYLKDFNGIILPSLNFEK